MIVGALVGLGLVIGGAILPWYSISANTGHWTLENSTFSISGTTTFLPGSEYRFSCVTQPPTAPIWGPICAQTQQAPGGVARAYASGILQQSGASGLGTLYGLILILSDLAVLLGLFAVALLVLRSLRRRIDSRSPLASGVCLLLAAGLCLGASLGVVALQPAAYSHDYGGALTGAGSSFWGSCGPSPARCGALGSGGTSENDSWGAAVGWYLDLSAGVIFAGLGLVILNEALTRRRLRAGSGPGKP